LRAVAAVLLALLLGSGAWLAAAPQADQPLLDLVEAVTGIGPAPFLSASEARGYADAVRDEQRYRAEAERLNRMEQESRYQGQALSPDDVRRLGSYMQSFNEMTRGEHFVRGVLRQRARDRARWWVGLPLAAVGLLGLGGLFVRAARPRTHAPRTS
jgi:zinc/manganese transport system permease protein